MKIWVVASYFDDLYILYFLNRFDFNYKVYLDWNNWPYQDKWFDFSLSNIEKWINYLISKWVDKVILPPIYEMHFDWDDRVLPLYKNYLEIALSKSLVWKIWILWDYSDWERINNYFSNFSSFYSLNENQKNIKKFNFPFSIWFKQVNLWKFFLNNLSFRQPLVNKTIKTDLTYFKDANVDTLITLNYWYLAFSKTIWNFFNSNKTKFYWKNALDLSLDKLFLDLEKENYELEIFSNSDLWLLFSSKKWNWIFNKWINFKYILKKM